MNDKIKALVLSINDYRENDSILQVISEDKSFLSLVVRGAKKLTTKHHFNTLCIYEFIIDYKDNKTIYTIHNGKLIESFYEDKDLALLSYKNILLELTIKSKELYEFELYKNICCTLRDINRQNMYLLGSLYVGYLLRLYGINPNVDSCVMCGNKKVVAISNRYGGFLCQEHLNQETTLSIDYLKKFRLINKANFNNYDLIKDVEYDIKDFSIIIDFFINNSDINIKSYKFYKELFG